MERIRGILWRYGILLLIGALSFFSINIFSIIFTPITIYPVYWISKIFFNAGLSGNSLFINGIEIKLIEACIAPSAYYLLLILNLSTGGIKTDTRIKIMITSFLGFLALNILRIIILVYMLDNNSPFFGSAHIFSWYLISTSFVILIWIANTKVFNIQKIPVYSDMKDSLHLRNSQ